jgi:hypothetical protein
MAYSMSLEKQRLPSNAVLDNDYILRTLFSFHSELGRPRPTSDKGLGFGREFSEWSRKDVIGQILVALAYAKLVAFRTPMERADEAADPAVYETSQSEDISCLPHWWSKLVVKDF